MAQPGLEISNVPWEAIEVDRWLREGNPTLGWRGDKRLSLRIGILTANNTGYDPRVKRFIRHGEVVARRYEVFRHCEDGTDQVILRRGLDQVHEIIPSLITQDPRTPNFEPVMDTVDREDAQVQKRKEDAIGEAIGQHAEHLWALVSDRQNGRTTFRGLPGRNPDKQL